jgi:hypothetical protein
MRGTSAGLGAGSAISTATLGAQEAEQPGRPRAAAADDERPATDSASRGGEAFLFLAG